MCGAVVGGAVGVYHRGLMVSSQAVVNVVGMTRMQPPIKDLLPRLTPILKNR